MNEKNQEQLKAYLQAVTRNTGGLDALIASLESNKAGTSMSGLEMMPTAVQPDQLADDVRALLMDKPISAVQYSGLEAIINEKLRPVVDIINDSFVLSDTRWAHLTADDVIRNRIEAILPSVGRIELPGHKTRPYGGTGFVVGDGLIMTNRHVAQIFAHGIGDKNLTFHPDTKAGINFKREFKQPEEETLKVKQVRMIHPYWDMALLEVEGLPPKRQALSLGTADARNLVGDEICVVGYPASDIRNPSDVQNALFSNKYGIKRLQPGELHGAIEVMSLGKTVLAAGHDCSTLGGNSGSAIIHLGTGEVLGLHFGGQYHQMNYGVPSAALASDSRVVDAGVRFAGSPPGGSETWVGYWAAADTDSPKN
ncbi:serine protease [Duganella sp. FT27W]|uniref:trypsin-like serine peptidase n=1 Tax=Duganella sp. FT27W TaxID=2654636 RepID=UPI00128CCC22|nr:serine protease [Duganella sp. FT27W]MPQ57487.1 trypsin-like serine protease [Duganella sp. FT27W]